MERVVYERVARWVERGLLHGLCPAGAAEDVALFSISTAIRFQAGRPICSVPERGLPGEGRLRRGSRAVNHECNRRCCAARLGIDHVNMPASHTALWKMIHQARQAPKEALKPGGARPGRAALTPRRSEPPRLRRFSASRMLNVRAAGTGLHHVDPACRDRAAATTSGSGRGTILRPLPISRISDFPGLRKKRGRESGFVEALSHHRFPISRMPAGSARMEPLCDISANRKPAIAIGIDRMATGARKPSWIRPGHPLTPPAGPIGLGPGCAANTT